MPTKSNPPCDGCGAADAAPIPFPVMGDDEPRGYCLLCIGMSVEQATGWRLTKQFKAWSLARKMGEDMAAALARD